VSRAKRKREFVIAKKIPPRGDAKNAMTAAKVRMGVIIDFNLLSSPPDGGRYAIGRFGRVFRWVGSRLGLSLS